MITKTRGRSTSGTDYEMIERAYEVFELVANGAPLQRIADHFGIDRETVRRDVEAVTVELNDRLGDRAVALREEIIARQRALIFANMPRARLGDVKSATIVQHADTLIANITGIRSIRVDLPPRPGTPITDAVEAYVAGITDAANATRT